MSRSVSEYVLLVLKGMAMGAADVVPGVSGGTIALITGIYNELLHSLKNLGPQSLHVLFKQGIKPFWSHINGNFLLAVFGGILLSLKTFALVISLCLEYYPLLVWGFFSGLIAASIVLLWRHQTRWRWQESILCIIGVVVVVFIARASPGQLDGVWWIMFLGGFVAICAMILPGISGSFILLLVGLYPVFIDAINTLNLVILLSFGFGAISGLLVFSRFLSWLLDHYYHQTIALLLGFLIGSLYVTWPWKQVVKEMQDRHGEMIPLIQVNVMPATFTNITGSSAQVVGVIVLVVVGIFLVLFTEFLAKRLSVQPKSGSV